MGQEEGHGCVRGFDVIFGKIRAGNSWIWVEGFQSTGGFNNCEVGPPPTRLLLLARRVYETVEC